MNAVRRCQAALLALGFVVATDASLATPVYRCGNAYSERPCPEGRALDADDGRTAGQHADARRVAAADRDRAARLERERLAREAVAPGVARLDRAPVTAPRTNDAAAGRRLARRDRNGRLAREDFVAFDASSRKKKRAD